MWAVRPRGSSELQHLTTSCHSYFPHRAIRHYTASYVEPVPRLQYVNSRIAQSRELRAFLGGWRSGNNAKMRPAFVNDLRLDRLCRTCHLEAMERKGERWFNMHHSPELLGEDVQLSDVESKHNLSPGTLPLPVACCLGFGVVNPPPSCIPSSFSEGELSSASLASTPRDTKYAAFYICCCLLAFA